MKTANIESNTVASTTTAPAELPVAVWNEETIMQALRIAQQENRDVIFQRVGGNPKGAIVLPILTLVEPESKRKRVRNDA